MHYLLKFLEKPLPLKGISDIEIELDNQVFILELKILRIKDIDESLQRALDQIVKKCYGAKHFLCRQNSLRDSDGV